jgi:rare lipoprotein A
VSISNSGLAQVSVRDSVVRLAEILLCLSLLSGCGHPKQARVEVPPPPVMTAESSSNNPSLDATPSTEPLPAAKSRLSYLDLAEPVIPANATPIETETGRASWYGPPYDKRRGSNGEIYNMHAMTAAHRTLPLGSIVRVTNLNTGQRALVRITDRGPFIPGRILDLSLAAAKKLDVYQPGTAEVKLEVMQTPVPLDSGGKWAVQIGGFPGEEAANKLAEHLKRRYQTAKVQSFPSPAGDWWVRVRVLDDDRLRAQKLAAETRSPEGAVFVVRLD